MALNPAFARLAARMGLPPPPLASSPSDIQAFENHLHALASAELAFSLDPARTNSLLATGALEPLQNQLSEAQAVAVAKAYGVKISFVAGLETWLGKEGIHGVYQEALQSVNVPAIGDFPAQTSPGRPEQILIESSLSPEVRASVAWHEVAHLAFGHHQADIPPVDLTIANLGARSQEYIANAVSSIMLDLTVPGSHPYITANSIGYMERFESALDLLHDPAYSPSTWDRASGINRATEFFRQNQDLILAKVAELKQVAKGVRLPTHSVDLAVIPPDQQVLPSDLSSLYSRLPVHLVDAAPVSPDFSSVPDFSAPLSSPA